MQDSPCAYLDALAVVRPTNANALAAAIEHQYRLTKPIGSLGDLEAIGAQLSAIAGVMPPPLPTPAAVAVFAGDHGVARAGVTPWPQEVTAQMVSNFLAGGAAINVFARQVGAVVTVVDVGVASVLEPQRGLRRAKVAFGTGDISIGPAMSHAEVILALNVGVETAADLVTEGARCLISGDMGIGNTTASAALIAAFCGQNATDATGRGTGIDNEMLSRKTEIVHTALGRIAPGADPLTVMAEVGGLEIAALAGFMIGGAAFQVPVIIDGVIALAAACFVNEVAPSAVEYLIAGHRPTEPGASVALEHLGLRPLIDLGLRLGEGTGACLAYPLVEASARVLREMATFDSAGVTDKRGEPTTVGALI